MKQGLRAICIVVIAAIYCLAAIIAGQNAFLNNADDASRHNRLDAFESNSFAHTFQVENSVKSFHNFSPSSLKNLPFSAYSLIQTASLLHAADFVRYLNQSEPLQVNFSKTDIIFPFHYFL